MISKTLLVIPHYNDTERLKPFLAELQRVLPGHFSILVSDDGSSADQREKLNSLIDQARQEGGGTGPEVLPALFTAKNTGKGGAVHRGWSQGEGYSVLAFADADGAVNALEILRAESYFRSEECGADALFGSRVKMLGRTVRRSLKRHLSGRIFATLVSELTKIPVYDSQCGLKIVTTETYQKIRPYLCTQGFAFDVELLLLLVKSGGKIIEFPVDWSDVDGSKVRLFRDSLRMARQIFVIKQYVHSLNFGA